MATPLLRSLRRQLPGVRLVACGDAVYGPLLDGLDSLDGFLPLTRRERRGGAAVLRQAAVLRRGRADAALILPNSWSSALAATLAGISPLYGRRGGGRGLLLRRSLAPIPGPAPMTELYADLLPLLGLDREVLPAELVAGPLTGALAASPGASESPAAGASGGWLAVAPGAAFGPSKELPDATLVAAIRALAAELGLRPLLLGAPGERPALTALAARLELACDLPDPEHAGLDQAKALLARSRLLLAMDNGARHMAAALGVPQVVVYGPTHPAWSDHARERTRLVRREELDCLSCHHQRCPLPDHPCMNRIEVEQILAPARELLAGS